MCTKNFLNLWTQVSHRWGGSPLPGGSPGDAGREMFCPPTWARSTGRGTRRQGDYQEVIQLSWGRQVLLLAPSPTSALVFLTRECLNENTYPLQQAASDVLALQTAGLRQRLFSFWHPHLLIPKAVHSWLTSLRQGGVPVCWSPMVCLCAAQRGQRWGLELSLIKKLVLPNL